MAQQVGYFEDITTPQRHDEAYAEGPFVIVNAWGWRIECEFPGSACPGLPDASIYDLLRAAGCEPGKTAREEAVRRCDWLNEQVRLGRIVLGTVWHAPAGAG